CAVKSVVHLRVTDLLDQFDHLLAVLLVDATQPYFKRCGLFCSETVQLAEPIIPVDVTCASIPHPGARSGSVQSETEPLFLFSQCLLDLYAVSNVDIVS